MEWTFTGEVIAWRGPAPYLFVAMTPEESEDLKEAARGLIYWGQVPVCVTIGGTEFTTALFPQGRPLPSTRQGGGAARREAIGEGAIVEVVLRLNARAPAQMSAWTCASAYDQVHCGPDRSSNESAGSTRTPAARDAERIFAMQHRPRSRWPGTAVGGRCGRRRSTHGSMECLVREPIAALEHA